MDPRTRRFMWDRINDLTRDDHTVLLTTHRLLTGYLLVIYAKQCQSLHNFLLDLIRYGNFYNL